MYHKQRCQHVKMKLNDSIFISNKLPMGGKINQTPHRQNKENVHRPPSNQIKEFDFSLKAEQKDVCTAWSPILQLRGKTKYTVCMRTHKTFPSTNFKQNILVVHVKIFFQQISTKISWRSGNTFPSTNFNQNILGVYVKLFLHPIVKSCCQFFSPQNSAFDKVCQLMLTFVHVRLWD